MFFERQDITDFSASFTYRANVRGGALPRQGLTFTVHNDPRGVEAVSTRALGFGGFSGFGYEGIENSAAVSIELDTGPGLTYSSFYSGGVIGPGSPTISPVNAFNGNDIDVTIRYRDGFMDIDYRDTVTLAEFSQRLPVGSLESLVGDSMAYVGFTASTAGGFTGSGGTDQFLSDFSYTVIPAPATLPLMGGLGLIALRRRR